MTNREPHTPHASPARPTTADCAHPEPAREGDDLLMSVTLATRPNSCSTTADAGDRGRLWLIRLAAGEFLFPAIPLATLPTADRTTAEFDAASRAAGCRDLFVVHADPVAGERLIVDISRAVFERVLILSPNPAAADRIAERLTRSAVSVLRALADDENPVRPSPVVSKRTSTALGSTHTEQLRREAASAITAAETRVAAFATVAKAVERLKEVNALLKQHESSIAAKNALRVQIEHEVRANPGATVATAVARLQAEHDETVRKLKAEYQEVPATLKQQEVELAEMKRQHAQAIRTPGFFARLFGAKSKAGTPEVTELEKEIQTRETTVTGLKQRLADGQAQIDSEAAAFATRREKLFAAEVASRCATVNTELADAERGQSHAKLEAAALTKAIETQGPGDDYTDAERQLTAARERVAEVVRAGSELIARVLAEPRVVVGTPGSLEADPVFRALSEPPFGLLVLDRAEELPEPEFDRLSRLAERWVLVGDALSHEEPRTLNGIPPTRASRNGRALEVSFVARLAKLLDRETWTTEGDRLVCRLTHPTAEERRGMTREPLADRPEIELRFTASEGDPLLAEISFPAGTTLPAAKSFLFHELGEMLLRPCGEYRWQHTSEVITVSWPAADTAPESVWIDLEAGVREKVSGTGLFAFTAAVSFDTSTGWDAEKAAAWLARYLPPPATSHFAALPRSLKMPHLQ